MRGRQPKERGRERGIACAWRRILLPLRKAPGADHLNEQPPSTRTLTAVCPGPSGGDPAGRADSSVLVVVPASFVEALCVGMRGERRRRDAAADDRRTPRRARPLRAL